MNQAAQFGRVVAGGLYLCGILLAAGCGGKGVVSGKVLYKGQPVRGGNVSFIPEGGGVMSSPIEEDGNYTIQNVPVGRVTITLETDSIRPFLQRGGPGSAPPPELQKNMNSDPAKQDMAKTEAQMADRAKRYVRIPPQYSDPNKSNLTYVVKSGKQEYDIELK
jgi:hypothetical protein